MDAEFCYGGRRKSRCSENQLECRPFRTIYIFPIFPTRQFTNFFRVINTSVVFGGQPSSIDRAAAKAARRGRAGGSGPGSRTRRPRRPRPTICGFICSFVGLQRNFVGLLIGKSKSLNDAQRRGAARRPSSVVDTQTD